MKLIKSSKKALATTVVSLVLATSATQLGHDQVSAASKFNDIKPGAFYEQAVNALSSKGVIGGYDDGTFKPNKPVTRAEAAKMLAYDLGLTTNLANSKFNDVKSGDWFFQPVTALSQTGGISGYEDGSFKPGKTITRAELASMLVKAYSLTNNGDSASSPFTDVTPTSWYASAIQTLYTNKITSGKTATQFAPNAVVTRGEIAAFINNVNNNSNNHNNETIESITAENTVTISGLTYNVSGELKGIFSSSNSEILKDATITFEDKNNTITKITYLQLNTSGNSAAVEFSGNLVLDGQGATINGKLQVNANYITLKNLTVNGDLEITSKLANDFYSENLKVKGATYVKGGDTNTVVFNNANLGNVQIQKEGVRVVAKGSTSVQEISVISNATINADATVTIPKITLGNGAKTVSLDAKVKTLEIIGKDAVSLSGIANIEELNIKNTASNRLNTKGTISSVIVQKDGKFSLGTETLITILQLPTGTELKDILSNYETAQKNVKGSKATETKTNTGGSGGTPSTQPAPTAESIINSYKAELETLKTNAENEFNQLKDSIRNDPTYIQKGTININYVLQGLDKYNEYEGKFNETYEKIVSDLKENGFEEKEAEVVKDEFNSLIAPYENYIN
ncbi:S-layer homology domain-containing protein [Bacillus sp. Marseille-P3661]|uniref:S-layer homology domain-containing protein n=1 Tax=Bacillus sp. Marseille-P3661 TaxID=1936234 RepID=UPI000C8503CC|nr:S-layer homology domain-containing protein [Bacillus sp. Marseille-P3661]